MRISFYTKRTQANKFAYFSYEKKTIPHFNNEMLGIKEIKREKYGLSRLFLLTMLLSFFGWAFETVYFLLYKGKYSDRGFLTLPFCPIYGCSLVGIYLLIGSPDDKVVKMPLYIAVCFLLPSLIELFIGVIFDKLWNRRLWTYFGYPYNLNGYICLRNSILWGIMAFLFMKYLFPPIKKAVRKLSERWSNFLAIMIGFSVFVDFLYNFIMLYC